MFSWMGLTNVPWFYATNFAVSHPGLGPEDFKDLETKVLSLKKRNTR